MGTPTGGGEERRVLGVESCLSSLTSRTDLGEPQICKRNGKKQLSFLRILSLSPTPTRAPQLLVTEWGVSHNFQAMPTLGQLTA